MEQHNQASLLLVLDGAQWSTIRFLLAEQLKNIQLSHLLCWAPVSKSEGGVACKQACQSQECAVACCLDLAWKQWGSYINSRRLGLVMHQM